MTYRSHSLDIYGADIYLATTKRDWSVLRRKVKSLDAKAPDSAGQATFATFQPNSGGLTVPVVIFWLDVKEHKTTVELIDTCAHEATHAAAALFEHIGHAPAANDEPHAYLVGWLTAWLWEQAGWSADA